MCRRQLVENTELMASPLHECSAHEWFSYLPSDLVDFSKKEADDFTSLHYYIMLVYLTMISDTIPDPISEQCQTIIDKLDLIERSVDKIKTTWKKSKHLKTEMKLKDIQEKTVSSTSSRTFAKTNLSDTPFSFTFSTTIH